jgi:LmbE family N-acetylglucosaminyl deacetylase
MKFKSILAIGAHPDDIEFSCFGFLLKQNLSGSKINIFIASPDSNLKGDQTDQRKQESIEAFKLIPDSKVIFRNVNKILNDDYEKLSDQIRNIVIEESVDLVLVHSSINETHQEHRLLNEITISALRRLPVSIFLYKSPSVTNNFNSNLLINIEKHYEIKLKAIKKHASQSDRTYMQEDAIKIFNQGWNGKLLGMDYSEEFNILRMVDNE